MFAYLVFVAGFSSVSLADDPPTPPAVPPTAVAAQPEDAADPTGPHSGPYKNAPDAVRAANQRLLSGDPESALEAYRQAEELLPDAREIAFGEGLAHYDLGAYESAREAFRKAAVAGDDLAVDSRYSMATCDHREALGKLDQPKEALSLIENAMRQYHDVLTERPDHAAARDANYKAASMWREIKRQMQQQEQQQEQNQDGEEGEQDENDEKKDSQESSESQEGEKQEDQENQSSENDKDEEQKEEQQQSESEKDKQKEDEKKKSQEQQAKQAEEKEQVSREQAERKLREMVQAMRDRKKGRRQPVDAMRARPVEKDW